MAGRATKASLRNKKAHKTVKIKIAQYIYLYIQKQAAQQSIFKSRPRNRAQPRHYCVEKKHTRRSKSHSIYINGRPRNQRHAQLRHAQPRHHCVEKKHTRRSKSHTIYINGRPRNQRHAQPRHHCVEKKAHKTVKIKDGQSKHRTVYIYS